MEEPKTNELWVARPREKSGDKWYETITCMAAGEMTALTEVVLNEYKSRLGGE